MMLAAIVITVVASTANNVGKALQKEATRTLPRFTLSKKVVVQYASCRAFVLGLLTDILGGVAMVAAFAMAPVSLVQPMSGFGLVTLSVFSHFYLKERLSVGEWAAAGVALIGAAGVGATQEESQDAVLPTLWRVLGVMAMLAAATCSLPILVRRRSLSGGPKLPPGAPRRQHSMPVGAAQQQASSLLGLQAGGFFGLSAAACRLGFLAARQLTWLAAPLGILSSIGLTSMGLMLQTVGLKDGNTVVVCTCAAVSSIVMGVLVGVLALNEGFALTLALGLLRALSLALLALGVSSLSGGQGAARKLLHLLLRSIPQSVLQRLPQRLALGIKQLSQRLAPASSLPT